MKIWLLIAGVAVVTAVIKAAGPVFLGGRPLPPRVAGVVALMAPALLSALVVTSALADGDRYQIDASTAGVVVGGLVVWWRGSVVWGVVIAAAVTALLRLLT